MKTKKTADWPKFQIGKLDAFIFKKDPPIISVSTLFHYLVTKYAIQYLENRSVLNPYPEEILAGVQI